MRTSVWLSLLLAWPCMALATDPCARCAGQGKQPYEVCVPCEGKGRKGKALCDICGGDGRKRCLGCAGTGQLPPANRLACRSCRASGKMACPACEGVGKTAQGACPPCKGGGRVACSRCQGKRFRAVRIRLKGQDAFGCPVCPDFLDPGKRTGARRCLLCRGGRALRLLEFDRRLRALDHWAGKDAERLTRLERTWQRLRQHPRADYPPQWHLPRARLAVRLAMRAYAGEASLPHRKNSLWAMAAWLGLRDTSDAGMARAGRTVHRDIKEPFVKADADRDGKLSAAELATASKQPGHRARSLLRRFDLDKDGALDPVEFGVWLVTR